MQHPKGNGLPANPDTAVINARAPTAGRLGAPMRNHPMQSFPLYIRSSSEAISYIH